MLHKTSLILIGAALVLTVAAPVAHAAAGETTVIAQASPKVSGPVEPRASKKGTSSSGSDSGTSAEKAGRELGKIIFAWASAIVFSLAALMVVVAVGRRNIAELLTVFMITGAGSLFVLNNAAGAQRLFQAIISKIT